MKRTALSIQNEASNKYSPLALSDFLIRAEDGTVVVDRARLLRSKDDERLFYVVLNRDYGWDYRNPDTATIYFEAGGGEICGGVYEAIDGRRSNRIVAVERGHSSGRNRNLYVYEPDVFLGIVQNIENS